MKNKLSKEEIKKLKDKNIKKAKDKFLEKKESINDGKHILK